MLSYRHADLLESLSKSLRVGDRVRPTQEYMDYLVGSGWKREDVESMVGSIENTVSKFGANFVEVRWDGDAMVDPIERSRIEKLP